MLFFSIFSYDNNYILSFCNVKYYRTFYQFVYDYHERGNCNGDQENTYYQRYIEHES